MAGLWQDVRGAVRLLRRSAAPVAAWIPLAHGDGVMPLAWRTSDRPALQLIGRLVAGVGATQAGAMLDPAARAIGDRQRMGPRSMRPDFAPGARARV